METLVISSAKNPTVKHLRKLLSNGKYRHEKDLAVAEGIHLVSSLLESHCQAQLYVCSESSRTNQEAAELIARLERDGVKGLVLKDRLFESLSEVHAAVGIMVVFTLPVVETRKLLESAIILEEIQDPGNLGTILRTAAAAGIKSVYLSPGSASAWSPKTLRAGMGAQFSLAIYENIDLLPLVQSTVLPVLSTSLQAELTIYQADLTSEVAWVFGNEGQGVSPELLEACTQKLIIPQAESSVESLNVAASVAVCLFEACRQQISN